MPGPGKIGTTGLGALALLVGMTSATRGELLYFVRGGAAQLPATIRGEAVRLEGPAGPFEFARSDFRKVVPGHWPEREWPERRVRAMAGGGPERFAAAWWALEQGLTAEAVAMLRDAHAADPRHEPAARLVAMLDRLAAPRPEPDVAPLLDVLGGTFEVARGPHVVLLHQHSAEEAAARVELLERVLTTFFLLLTADGIELKVPRERLVSVWFARRRDYLAFLHAEKADAFASTRGYYHPTRRIVFAFDERDAEPHRLAAREIRVRQEELGRLIRSAGSGQGPTGSVWDRRRRDLDRRRLLLDLDRRAIDQGTAAHEMVHQLVAASGLLPRHDAFPVWLQEGLAMQFEVVRGGRWAGIGKAHDLRLPDWRTIVPAPRLAPLVRDAGFGQGYHRDPYAQAWSLVYFLRKERPEQFVTFLDLLRVPDPESPVPGPERTLAAFRRAFGSDLAALESDWHHALADVKTPLEAEAPPRP